MISQEAKIKFLIMMCGFALGFALCGVIMQSEWYEKNNTKQFSNSEKHIYPPMYGYFLDFKDASDPIYVLDDKFYNVQYGCMRQRIKSKSDICKIFELVTKPNQLKPIYVVWRFVSTRKEYMRGLFIKVNTEYSDDAETYKLAELEVWRNKQRDKERGEKYQYGIVKYYPKIMNLPTEEVTP